MSINPALFSAPYIVLGHTGTIKPCHQWRLQVAVTSQANVR